MANQSTVQPKMDYVKYIIPMDTDRIQQLGARINAAIMDKTVPFDHGRGFKLSVLDSTPTTGGKRRLVLDAWGPATKALIDWLDSSYVPFIVRLDYRRELRSITRDHVRGYLTRMVLGAKKKRNITTYDTNDRQKTHSRDVGGYGLTIGSRKSDSHTTIYQRG